MKPDDHLLIFSTEREAVRRSAQMAMEMDADRKLWWPVIKVQHGWAVVIEHDEIYPRHLTMSERADLRRVRDVVSV